MAWIRRQPCAVCGKVPSEAAHTGPHAGYQLADDRTCIPLCVEHHRSGKDAEHAYPRLFWVIHRLEKRVLWRKYNTGYAAVDPRFEALLVEFPA